MTLLAVGPQFGIKYTLTGPDGTVVTFNDQNDPNNVGTLTAITGFDSPEVRENADDLVQQDGGIHGDFFYGRRPITMSGLLHEHTDAGDRNLRMTRLMQATNAMRADATLEWLPEGGEEVNFVTLRRSQPLRIEGNWNKTFQISMVAADPRIYSTQLRSLAVSASEGTVEGGRTYNKSYPFDYGGAGQGFEFDLAFDLNFGPSPVTGQVLVTNRGNALSYPVLTINGPGTNPVITNETTGQSIALTYTLGVDDEITIDTLNRTVILNGQTSRYSAIDFVNTEWWGLVPDVNDVRLQYFSYATGAGLRVDWRDAWM